ncbi:MAG: host nuclease inhibitor protein [Gallionellaceae bacterium]|nr:host nuclease inhibitor protein [Gallionellaceae bacterium]
MIAYCYRSGQIRFGRSLPEGAIKVAEGPSKKLRAMICVTSRHAYDGKTLLVPGIPEAETEKEAEDALRRFLNWIAPRVTKLRESR